MKSHQFKLIQKEL